MGVVGGPEAAVRVNLEVGRERRGICTEYFDFAHSYQANHLTLFFGPWIEARPLAPDDGLTPTISHRGGARSTSG